MFGDLSPGPVAFFPQLDYQKLTVPFGESGRCFPQLSQELASAGFESNLPSGRAAGQLLKPS